MAEAAEPGPAGTEPPQFSVIVPLEFHRGQSERCIKAWTQNQTYPRSLYEVVVVAPDDHCRRELDGVRSLLTERDRLLLCAERHDMGLVVVGAQAAGGDLLFFTESHCWPEPDVLEKAAAALQSHPEWAGLSCGLDRVTHNPLSVVEAEMYQFQMEYGMVHHPWRKVLDPCFAVRREAYFHSGGFEAGLGHFAEWMLAARFWRLGLRIGYAPEARVHHYYIGRVRELKEFTADFTEGEMLAFARMPDDPCAELFPEPPEWSQRHRWRQRLAAGLARLAWREWRRSKKAGADTPGWATAWGQIARWLPAATAGVVPAWLAASLRVWVARCRLWWNMCFVRQESLNAAFLSYVAAVVRVRRLRFLLLNSEDAAHRKNRSLFIPPEAGEWEPARRASVPALGLHLAEEWNGQPFRWSEPAALVELNLPEGSSKIVFTWLPIRPPGHDTPPRLHLDECPVPPERVCLGANRAEITVKMKFPGTVRLGWTCAAFHAPGDNRLLGLPVRKIAWNLKKPARAAHP